MWALRPAPRAQSTWGRWKRHLEGKPGRPALLLNPQKAWVHASCAPWPAGPRGDGRSVSPDLASLQRDFPEPGLEASLCQTLQGLPATPGMSPQPLGPAHARPPAPFCILRSGFLFCVAFSLSVPSDSPALPETPFAPAASPVRRLLSSLPSYPSVMEASGFFYLFVCLFV